VRCRSRRAILRASSLAPVVIHRRRDGFAARVENTDHLAPLDHAPAIGAVLDHRDHRLVVVNELAFAGAAQPGAHRGSPSMSMERARMLKRLPSCLSSHFSRWVLPDQRKVIT